MPTIKNFVMLSAPLLDQIDLPWSHLASEELSFLCWIPGKKHVCKCCFCEAVFSLCGELKNRCNANSLAGIWDFFSMIC